MTDGRIYPAFGDLNPVEEQKVGKTLDPRNSSPFSLLKLTALELFKKDSFNNSGPLKGIVLRIENNPNDLEPNSWISNVFGSERVSSLKVLKVRIPEIHAALPEPAIYGASAEDSNKVIDMYPSFVADNEEISNKPVAPGDIVLVDFANRENLSQPTYLGPVFNFPTPGAVGESSAKELFEEKKVPLAVLPPIGDDVAGEEKKEENQLPQQIDNLGEDEMGIKTLDQVQGLIPDPPEGFHELTYDEIKKIMPSAKDENIKKYLFSLNQAMALFDINTPKRQAAFLAQIAVESGSLKYDTELASGEAYEGRVNLGNINPGDGPRYKGRGLLQLTGRTNYTKMTQKLANLGFNVDLINEPELATRPDISAIIAGQYFKDRNINKYSDDGNITKVSKLVNGGTNGLDRRIKTYDIALKVLTGTQSVVEKPKTISVSNLA